LGAARSGGVNSKPDQENEIPRSVHSARFMSANGGIAVAVLDRQEDPTIPKSPTIVDHLDPFSQS